MHVKLKFLFCAKNYFNIPSPFVQPESLRFTYLNTLTTFYILFDICYASYGKCLLEIHDGNLKFLEIDRNFFLYISLFFLLLVFLLFGNL